MLIHRVGPWAIAIAILCGTASLAAQLDRGTIRGAVVDATGSALSRVAVSASNVDTGIVTSGVTNDKGLYSLLNLPVGRYTVAFARDGAGVYFKSHDAMGHASIWYQRLTGGRPTMLVRFDDFARQSYRSNLAVGAGRFFFAMNDRQSDVFVAELTTR